MTSPFDILKKYQLPNPKSVIQVGASGGQELEEFIAAGITDALLIEPLDGPFSVLQHRVQNIPSYVPFKALVSATNGKEFVFYIASNGGQSSSLLEPGDHLEKFPYVSFPEKIKLTGYRLDSLFAFLISEKRIGFDKAEMLYIDVQGAELYVLRGAGELLESVQYIWVEIGTGLGYKGAANYKDIIHYLDIYGYQLIYLECDPNNFGDALFVKIA